MKAKRKPTAAETRRFIQRMRRMKANERAGGVEIFADALMRATIVVKVDGVLWLCPMSANGWSRRQRLTLTPEVRLERLKPARHISADWLGIPRQQNSSVHAPNHASPPKRRNEKPSNSKGYRAEF